MDQKPGWSSLTDSADLFWNSLMVHRSSFAASRTDSADVVVVVSSSSSNIVVLVAANVALMLIYHFRRTDTQTPTLNQHNTQQLKINFFPNVTLLAGLQLMCSWCYSVSVLLLVTKHTLTGRKLLAEFHEWTRDHPNIYHSPPLENVF